MLSVAFSCCFSESIFVESLYAECHFCIVMLSVIGLSVLKLKVIMLSISFLYCYECPNAESHNAQCLIFIVLCSV